jgi:hypothetical protein
VAQLAVPLAVLAAGTGLTLGAPLVLGRARKEDRAPGIGPPARRRAAARARRLGGVASRARPQRAGARLARRAAMVLTVCSIAGLALAALVFGIQPG